ncbi:hypothetical protein [Fulvivirga lutimaris]|uniref:hypothetical protein n=1 Tax=Fulvivirga lutimaris TaxID=1819566 RepID=UPI0012BB8212|nr:hypothetical protein [Fulvivirga lutimaris]MTI38387.1 hypothetical protein [Fulvivirga lutimaris]
MANSINISQIKLNDKPFLKFDFPEYLDLKIAEEAISNWKTQLSDFESNNKVDLIFNCMDMSGFDTEARKIWQNTLKELKPQTGQIWVVCENLFILGAAKTMGILSGYQIKVTRSIEKVGDS